MKKLLILLILGILVIGCIGKPTKNEENTKNITTTNIDNVSINVDNASINIEEKEKFEKEDWYMTVYEGPSDIANSENARMSIIPHLRELGWNGGINVMYGRPESANHTIIIVLPFQLTKESANYINITLSNYSYVPLILNEKVVNK